MSWEDQCKAIFKVHVDAEYHRYRKKNAGIKERARIINRFAKEAMISQQTLKRWYYELTFNKKLSICKKCKKNHTHIAPNTLCPRVSGENINLCNTCINKKSDPHNHKKFYREAKNE